jgi:predicted ATPase/class 3 adenylate cyclase
MLTTTPPTGTVTFLFTDMEGSTRLWDRFPDVMDAVVAAHDRILGEVVESTGGYVFAQAGDGWAIAYASPRMAVRAALDIQRRLTTQAWPEPIPGVRVRIGLHAGSATTREGDYFGSSVNRAARVSAAANGGQVFMTDAVRALIVDDMDPEWRLRDLGEHRLRDLTRTERIWQIDSLDVPAPAALAAPRKETGNLPKRGTRILGRDDDIAEITAALAPGSVITLSGVGGVGKTTIAIEVGRQLDGVIPGGSWFVDLTSTDDPSSLAPTINSALGISKRQGMTDLESLIDALNAEDRLVILDNAEQQVDAVASLVDELAGAIPGMRVVVTSREPLAISCEVVRRISPLPIGHDAASPAVALFIERGRISGPDLAADAFPVDVVEAICSRLDGLPLAIELAAAHAETMTPTEILAALRADSLELRSDSRSVSARHRSLDDLVAWSYERLDAAEQRVFERMSVFRGGASSDAIEAICSGEDLDATTVRTALRTLVRRSMVATERSGGATRFTMLETLRHYSIQLHAARSERESVEERHADWFAEFARARSEEMSGPLESEALSALVREFDNLAQAARWASRTRALDVLAQLGSGLPYVLESSLPSGIDEWVDDALDTLPEDDPARADYAYTKAYVTLFYGDLRGWSRTYDLATAGVAHLPRVVMMREGFRLISAFFLGDVDTVISDSPAAIRDAFDIGELRLGASLSADLGLALHFRGDTEAAWTVANDLHERAEAWGIPSVLAWSLYLLGELNSATDPTTSIEQLEEVVEYGVSFGNGFAAGISLIALAATAGRHGDRAIAVDAMLRCIRLWHGAGNRPQFWTAIRNLVEILHQIGLDAEAYTLHAASEAAAGQAPELFGPFGDHYLDVVKRTVEHLDAGEATLALRDGAALDYHATAAYAIDLLDDL